MVGDKTRWALAAHGDGVDMDHWIADSGASRHLVRDVSMLENAVDCDEPNWLLLPIGKRLQVTKRGTDTLAGIAEGKEFELQLSTVYFAPLLSRNLISFGLLAQHGCRIESRHGGMVITKGTPSQSRTCWW
ncbi:hypothetical protein CCR75_005850 [Bremia lactucae]|uniref:Retrovirus-related Pol polyprotein from transposon TNT 1-94-like beta-barrel domain-containing protein n=1 Tax=Bremia lactucae TaxID=4779 RepID=A0A976FFW4_BRELC|nr:hypothetical protein CCR75_005850 [Bremia lactucae]